MFSRPPESLVGRKATDYNHLESDVWGLDLCCIMLLTGDYAIVGIDADYMLQSIHEHTVEPSYDDFTTFTTFKAALLDGSISGSLDIDKLLSGHIDYSLIGRDPLDKLITMLQLNPADRITVQQLTGCGSVDADNDDNNNNHQIVSRNLMLAFLSGYQQHVADLWWLIRGYTDSISLMTMTYEIALRLLSLTDDVVYVEQSIAVICCLADRYLFEQLIPVNIYRYLAGYTNHQEFMSATVRLLELLSGHIYNYHCSAAIESVTVEMTDLTTSSTTSSTNLLTDYYRPTAVTIEHWYDDIAGAVYSQQYDQQYGQQYNQQSTTTTVREKEVFGRSPACLSG